jgi:5-methyltetrahydropteroyltriglutamate--homocysteine methyltransferase
MIAAALSTVPSLAKPVLSRVEGGECLSLPGGNSKPALRSSKGGEGRPPRLILPSEARIGGYFAPVLSKVEGAALLQTEVPMKRSIDRILTTHVGSLVRPLDVIQVLQTKPDGVAFTAAQRDVVHSHIRQAVRQQAECGIDIPSDGEYSKPGFSGYVTDRLTGFELRTDLPGRGGGTLRSRDRRIFADAYREIEAPGVPGSIMATAAPTPAGAVVCTSPITYRGQDAVQADLDTFRAAMAGLDFEEAFIPAVGPATIELQRANHFYKTEEEFLFAIADAMKTEYRMIVEAGFILQIDDPRIVTEYDSMDPAPTAAEYRKFAAVRIEALNHALAGLPEDQVRYHVCWGSWHGPHTTDAPLREIASVILQVNAGAFSLEAANPRHEHEYHVWEDDIKFPDGKIVIPGVVAHTTNCVEHPELIAERITRYARIVGRENVIAGVDCGFAQGTATARVHTTIMWEIPHAQRGRQPHEPTPLEVSRLKTTERTEEPLRDVGPTQCRQVALAACLHQRPGRSLLG